MSGLLCKIGGTEGLRFNGTLTADSIEREVEGIIPAEYKVSETALKTALQNWWLRWRRLSCVSSRECELQRASILIRPL